MMDRRQFQQRLLAAAAGMAAAAGGSAARAAAFPQRPVRLVVPFAAGGGPDLLARETATRFAPALGAHAVVIVENVVGAGGLVAARNLARANPDGHQLLLGASSHVVQRAMQPSAPFDPLKDFAPVSCIGTSPSVLVVAADSPYRQLDDLITAARQRPGVLNYASGGIGSAAHLAGAALGVHARIDALHVPYKGSVDILPAVLTHAVHYAFPIASTALPQVQAGKLRALAVTGAKRLAALPQVPTLLEITRNEDLVLEAWFGLWAPAGTPADTVQQLFRALHLAFEDAALRERVQAAGTVLSLSESPAQFARFMRAEAAKFDRLVQAARLSGG